VKEIKAIIVDDEESARNVLDSILTKYIDGIKVLAKCADVETAVEAVKSNKPDVVFLDIEMPNYSGFEFLTFFDQIDFEIIFVSAYGEYAIKAFDVSAVDYVLKPIQIEKIENSIKKLSSKIQLSNMQERYEVLQENLKHDEVNRLALPMSDGLVFVNTSDINYLTADGSYTHIFLINGSKYFVSKKLKFFETALIDNPNFVRVHRSSIVNLKHVNKYSKHDGALSFNNNEIIKVARDRKSELENILRKFKV
jgi:two-component system LytT family response regulator